MLVVFHFHQLGYSTLEMSLLFLFYEFFGIITNLYGGWLGARGKVAKGEPATTPGVGRPSGGTTGGGIGQLEQLGLSYTAAYP